MDDNSKEPADSLKHEGNGEGCDDADDLGRDDGEIGDEEDMVIKSEGSEIDDESDIPFNNPFRYSREELSHISAIEKECVELFPPDKQKLYDNKQSLKKSFQELIGDKYGFYISIEGQALRCTRCDAPAAKRKQHERIVAKTPVERRRRRVSIKCGCTFAIHTSYAKFKKEGGRKKPDLSGPVFIRKVDYIHSQGCSGKTKKVYTQSNEKKLSLDELHDMKVQRLGELVTPHKDSEEKAKKLHTTEMVNYFRPMFQALASHPQQRTFLNVLDGIKNVVVGNSTEEDSAVASGDVRKKIMLFGTDGDHGNNTEDNSTSNVKNDESLNAEDYEMGNSENNTEYNESNMDPFE